MLKAVAPLPLGHVEASLIAKNGDKATTIANTTSMPAHSAGDVVVRPTAAGPMALWQYRSPRSVQNTLHRAESDDSDHEGHISTTCDDEYEENGLFSLYGDWAEMVESMNALLLGPNVRPKKESYKPCVAISTGPITILEEEMRSSIQDDSMVDLAKSFAAWSLRPDLQAKDESYDALTGMKDLPQGEVATPTKMETSEAQEAMQAHDVIVTSTKMETSDAPEVVQEQDDSGFCSGEDEAPTSNSQAPIDELPCVTGQSDADLPNEDMEDCVVLDEEREYLQELDQCDGSEMSDDSTDAHTEVGESIDSKSELEWEDVSIYGDDESVTSDLPEPSMNDVGMDDYSTSGDIELKPSISTAVPSESPGLSPINTIATPTVGSTEHIKDVIEPPSSAAHDLSNTAVDDAPQGAHMGAAADSGVLEGIFVCSECKEYKNTIDNEGGVCFDCRTYVVNATSGTDSSMTPTAEDPERPAEGPQTTSGNTKRQRDSVSVGDSDDAEDASDDMDQAQPNKRGRLEGSNPTMTIATFARDPMHPTEEYQPLKELSPWKAEVQILKWMKRIVKIVNNWDNKLQELDEQHKNAATRVISSMTSYLRRPESRKELTSIIHRLRQINDYGSDSTFVSEGWNLSRINSRMVHRITNDFKSVNEGLNDLEVDLENYVEELNDIRAEFERFESLTIEVAPPPRLAETPDMQDVERE